MDIFKNDRLYIAAVFFIIIAGIILRAISFYNNVYNILGDECHSVVCSILPIKELFINFFQGANMLPLYRCLIRVIYEVFGFNWIFLKLPSLIAGCISIILFYCIIKKIFVNKVIVLTALTLFSLNYSLIRYSSIIKPYEIEVLIMLIMLNTVLSIDKLYKNTKKGICIPLKTLFAMTITTIVFVFTSLPAIVVAEMYWCLLLFKDFLSKNYRNFINILLCQLIILCSIIYQYFIYIIKIQSDLDLKGQWLWPNFYFKPDSIEALNSLSYFCFFKQYMFDSEITDKLPLFFIIAVLICFLAGVIYMLKDSLNFIKNKVNYESFLSLYIVLPVLTFIFLSFLDIFPFTNRVILFLLPHLIIIILYAFDKNETKIKYYLHSFLTIFLMFYICCIFSKDYLLPYIIFDNSNSKINNSTIHLLESVKSDDEIIFSTEKLCIYCINNSNIYTFEDLSPLLVIIDKEHKDFFFNKVEKKITSKFDENIFKDKNKVYYIDSQDPISTEQDKKLLDIINKYGFSEKYRKYESIFLSYIVFEK